MQNENTKQTWFSWLIYLAAGLGIAAGLYLLAPQFMGKAKAADFGKPANVFADAPVAKLSWTGLYFGLHGGYSAANGEITAGAFGLDGLSATGTVGGIDAGADWQVPGSCVVVGARAGYTWSDVAVTISPGIASATIDDGWHADGRLGCAMGTALPYVFGGYGKVHTSTTILGTGLASPDLKGWRAGLGVEWGLANMGTGNIRPTLAVEGMYRDFDAIGLGGPAKLDVTDLTAMVRLNLRLFDGYRK